MEYEQPLQYREHAQVVSQACRASNDPGLNATCPWMRVSRDMCTIRDNQNIVAVCTDNFHQLQSRIGVCKSQSGATLDVAASATLLPAPHRSWTWHQEARSHLCICPERSTNNPIASPGRRSGQGTWLTRSRSPAERPGLTPQLCTAHPRKMSGTERARESGWQGRVWLAP